MCLNTLRKRVEERETFYTWESNKSSVPDIHLQLSFTSTSLKCTCSNTTTVRGFSLGTKETQKQIFHVGNLMLEFDMLQHLCISHKHFLKMFIFLHSVYHFTLSVWLVQIFIAELQYLILEAHENHIYRFF